MDKKASCKHEFEIDNVLDIMDLSEFSEGLISNSNCYLVVDKFLILFV